jgi:hypothetical protein
MKRGRDDDYYDAPDPAKHSYDIPPPYVRGPPQSRGPAPGGRGRGGDAYY